MITKISQFPPVASEKSPNPQVKATITNIIQVVIKYLTYSAVLNEAAFKTLFPKTVADPNEKAASKE